MLTYFHALFNKVSNGRLMKNHIVNMAVVYLSLMSLMDFHQVEFQLIALIYEKGENSNLKLLESI